MRDAHSPLVSYVRTYGEVEAERCGEMLQHVAAPSSGGGGGGRWLIVLDGRRAAPPRSLATFSSEKRLILSWTRPLRGCVFLSFDLPLPSPQPMPMGSAELLPALRRGRLGGAGGGRFARDATMLGWMADLQMEVESLLEADRPGGIGDGRWGCARSRACSFERAAMLCHEFCCLHSRACSLALAAVSRHAEGCLGPRFLGDPSSSSSPFEPMPGRSSAVNRRPFADPPSFSHLPSLTPLPIFRVAFHCERTWHHRQQRHRSRLGKVAAEIISSIAHRSFGRPGGRKARAEHMGSHAGCVRVCGLQAGKKGRSAHRSR